MPASLYQQNKWRYWRARALESMGHDEAATVFSNLAGESDYYGFLAAARLGRPFRLCSRELTPDGALQLALYQMPEFIRALELRRAGLDWHARWTWQRHIAVLQPELLEQAALAASAIGWYDRAITSLAAAGAMSAYRWRFPLLQRERIIAEAARHGVDPALALGMMRAESAMQADARSPADARGLLQLIDSTARAVARRQGIAYSGPADLYRPERNIALGVAHLGELLTRFDGDWTRVAAAYNAGIRNAERWHDQRPGLPTDIWIETLSFHETRDYIPRVLAFATIYEWQLNHPPMLLAESVLGAPAANTSFACPGS
jgi:soluble lytic murein transglycosylase